MAHDVFISFASSDKTVADAICNLLERREIRCWMAPRDICPGATWAGEIVDAIAASKVAIVVVSDAANESPQVLREVERAVESELIIIPFRIDDIHLSKSLKYFMSSCHWLDALTPPLEAHIKQLAVVVSGFLQLPRADDTLQSDKLRLTVHIARFRATGTACCFINATNLCRDVDIEITHVWLDSDPQVFAENADRPLPKRLKPHETWETWIAVQSVPGELFLDQLYNLARARMSTGEVVSSTRNDSVPASGAIPGGPISEPP